MVYLYLKHQMNKVADVNTRLADEKEQRLRRIRLIEQETAEMAPIWKAKQATLYPTAVPITQTPTLGQVITEEMQKNALNPDALLQRAEQKVIQLADKTNTEYILDRLEDNELFYLVNSWDAIIKELKEKYNSKSLDKNIFIALVKKNAEEQDTKFQGININDLTTQGKLKKQQKEERLKEIENELINKETADEAERKRLGDLRNQQVADEEQEEFQRRQQELLQKAKQRKIQNLILKNKSKLQKAPAPASATSPLVNNDDPFVYDPSQDVLTGNYETDFLNEYSKEETNVNTLSDDDAVKIYEKLENHFPSKMSSVNGLSIKSKLKNFVRRALLDKYFDRQNNAPATPSPTPSTPPPPPPTTPPPMSPSAIRPMGITLPRDDDPFVFDPKTNTLTGEYDVEFSKTYSEVEEKINKSDPDKIDEMLVRLEAKYPNKITSIGRFNKDKTLLKKFLKQTLLDKYFDIQTKDEIRQKKISDNLEKFKKTIPDTSTAILQRKDDLKKMLRDDLYNLAIKHGKIRKDSNKEILINHILKGEYAMEGYGLKKKRRIVGRGMEEGVNDAKKSKETVMKKVINGKYIDLNKLKNNIICIRYCKTRALVPNVKVQHISNGVKEIIDDIINDKFEKRLYEKLDMNEKRLVKRIVDSLKLDIDTSSKEEEEYQRQYEVVLGQFQAGNNNPLIKNKLKQYLVESMESGMIPRREAFKLLFELANS